MDNLLNIIPVEIENPFILASLIVRQTDKNDMTIYLLVPTGKYQYTAE